MVAMSAKNQFQSIKALFDVPRSPQSFEDCAEIPTKTENRNPDILQLVKKAQAALSELEQALSPTETETVPPVNGTIEGVFDGKQLIAEDGSVHTVPENYASKSRLVEGDLLTLKEGKFRQVHRVKRKKLSATVSSIDMDGGSVSAEDGSVYRVLRAPLTFFKLRRGDTLHIDTPETPGAKWAAVVEPETQRVNFAYSK